MSRMAFAGELQSASDRIADVPRADLQVMLRRAALMIRNTAGIDLDPSAEASLLSIAYEMRISQSELIKVIIGEWLVAHAYVPVPVRPDEDRETDGRA